VTGERGGGNLRGRVEGKGDAVVERSEGNRHALRGCHVKRKSIFHADFRMWDPKEKRGTGLFLE